jgi:hypothetical protein
VYKSEIFVMEELLLRVGSQAANFAIRSGLGYASKLAFVQLSKFIQVSSYEANRLLIDGKLQVKPLRNWRK